MAESPKPPDDELTQRLREAVRRQRPRASTVYLLAFVLLALPFSLYVWWLSPWSRPPELTVVAFDQVAQPGKPVAVRAATQPPEGDANRWGGQVLYFEEMVLNPANRDKPAPVLTDSDGLAEYEWTVKVPANVTEIEVRYVDERLRPPWFSRDRVRIFTWPRGTRLLVIDVEPTLKKAVDWPAVAKALADARTAGWQIAYMGLSADTPRAYAKLRDWVITQATADKQPLPDGPVLARASLFQRESEAAANKSVLAVLRRAFSAPMLYVTGEAGLTIHTVIDTGDLAADPQRVNGWSDLIAALPK